MRQHVFPTKDPLWTGLNYRAMCLYTVPQWYVKIEKTDNLSFPITHLTGLKPCQATTYSSMLCSRLRVATTHDEVTTWIIQYRCAGNSFKPTIVVIFRPWDVSVQSPSHSNQQVILLHNAFIYYRKDTRSNLVTLCCFVLTHQVSFRQYYVTFVLVTLETMSRKTSGLRGLFGIWVLYK